MSSCLLFGINLLRDYRYNIITVKRLIYYRLSNNTTMSKLFFIFFFF